MDFLGMEIGEIVLILVVALIIWGPGRIAEIGRTLGKMVRTLRKATFDLTAQVTKELEEEEKDRPLQHRGNSSNETKPETPASKVGLPRRGN